MPQDAATVTTYTRGVSPDSMQSSPFVAIESLGLENRQPRVPVEAFSELGPLTITLIGLAAIVTASIHGATGVAGGFLMSAVLALVIGAKPVVPIMSIALLISHSSRFFLNFSDFDKKAYFAVAITAIPFIALASWGYGRLSSTSIALILGVVILLSIPLRRWAQSRQIKANAKTLGAVGAVYGGLSGVSVGPGMLLIPFMLGYGLSRTAFVATLAAIAVTTNLTRSIVFGATNMLDTHYLLLGVFIGLCTIPGNWIGRSILRRMTNENHSGLVDGLTVIGALNFFWIALR